MLTMRKGSIMKYALRKNRKFAFTQDIFITCKTIYRLNCGGQDWD